MIGQTVSHFEILERLGQGGMGVVYKRNDRTFQRILAEALAKHEDFKKRFFPR